MYSNVKKNINSIDDMDELSYQYFIMWNKNDLHFYKKDYLYNNNVLDDNIIDILVDSIKLQME